MCALGQPLGQPKMHSTVGARWKHARWWFQGSDRRALPAGHMVALDVAVAVVLACCTFRIPEPIRQADLRSRAFVRRLRCEAEALRT
jgi:deoxyinosine 3'endonuclease (endonuclease V)